jgi:hypothetical protein
MTAQRHRTAEAEGFPWVPDLRDHGGTKAAPGFIIRCSKCEAGASYRGPRHTPVEKVMRLMAQKGWKAGGSRAKDLCPACLVARRLIRLDDHRAKPFPILDRKTGNLIPRTTKPQEAPMPTAEVLTMTPERPNATPEERRQVLDALNRCHDGRRYGGHESDAALAERLGVNRLLVAEIREQFIGGPDENEETAKSRLTVQELAERLEAAKAELKAAEDATLKALDKVGRTVADIETRLGRLERHLAPKSARGAK